MRGEITNSIGMKLVLISAGEFRMGAKLSVEEVYGQFPGGPKDTSYYKAPRHKVRITRPFNPTGPTSGSLRVVKGGCWYYGAWFNRAACRLGDQPGIHGAVLGFRVVLIPSE